MTEAFRVTTHAAARVRPMRVRRAQPVEVRVVNRRVLAIAKRMADGDVTRLVVESPNSVLVLNGRRRS